MMNPRTEKPETIHEKDPTNIRYCKVSEHIKRQFLKFLEKREKPLDTYIQRFRNENGIQLPQIATLGSQRQ